MNSKYIQTSKEYRFNVRCEDSFIDLKLDKVYEYQIASDTLLIGNANAFVQVEILDVKDDVLEELKKYSGRSLLRMDKVNNDKGIYVLNLLEFYEHINFDEGYQIVIDQAIYPELRSRSIKVKDAANYFTKEIVFDSKYWFSFGNDRRNSEQTLLGENINIVVKPSAQGYLHVIKIDWKVKGKSAENLITLMSGKIEFKDNFSDLKRINKDFIDKYKQATKDNTELIDLWRIYDELDLQVIKNDTTEMGFIQYKNYKRNNGDLIFSVHGGYVSPDFLRSGMQYIALPLDDFNRENPLEYDIKIGTVIGCEYNNSCVNTSEFVISEETEQFRKLPDKGYIIPSINGSIVQSKRRDIARRNILSGKNSLLGLNLLLQSGDIVGIIGKNRPAITDHLRKYIFEGDKSKGFNDRQKEAIRVAINTPDIAVIQGPPGTGKTKVIKAIVERINEIENGKARILITSTQHDAVENAVSDISYGGVPVNRVLSRQRSTTEDAPIYEWIDKMISSCGNWIENNITKSSNQDINRCVCVIKSAEPKVVVEELKQLYHLLQSDGYSAELLAKVNKIIVNMISYVQPTFDLSSNSRLKELLKEQRLENNAYLIDGSQNLKSLEFYLRNEYDDTVFEIPPYWKKLRRITTDTTELRELLALLQKDIEALEDENCSTSSESSTSAYVEELTTFLSFVESEMAERGDEITDEEKLYNQIWLFKQELSNIENTKRLISSYSQVNAATCQQAASKYINPAMKGFEDEYDYVIIDEAARSNPLDLLIPMSMGKKIILVGDHKQLPHIVEADIVDAVIKKTNDDSAKHVLEESLFTRLFNKVKEADTKAKINIENPLLISRTCTLNEQFRMHSEICDLINVFYQEEQLKTACKDIDRLHNLNLYNNKPLVWIDVSATENHPLEKRGKSKSRPCEVTITKEELNKILAANADYDIGIISFYSEQVKLLKQMVEEEFPSDIHRISVGTVDAFQGKEFDIVILSTVRSNRQTKLDSRVGFLNNNNRLCVAFSRAKRLLITIGDSKTVANDGNITYVEPLNELFERSKREDSGYYEII